MKKALLITILMLMVAACGDDTDAQTSAEDEYNPDKWTYIGPDGKKSKTSIPKPVGGLVKPTAEQREWIDSLGRSIEADFPKWDHRFSTPSRSKTKERSKLRVRRNQLLAIIIYNLRYDSYEFLCSEWSDDETMMGQPSLYFHFDTYALRYRDADILKELEALEPKMQRISKKELYCDKVEALGKTPGSITPSFIRQYKTDNGLN